MMNAKELNWLISLVKKNRDDAPRGINAKDVFDELSGEYERHIVPDKGTRGHFIAK